MRRRFLALLCLVFPLLASASPEDFEAKYRFMDVSPQGKKGDFITRFVKKSPAVTHRRKYGIYQFPMTGMLDSEGPCGSLHIRSLRSKPHMRPVSACMFTAVAQEWREKYCPANTPDCQLMFGDMSYGDEKPKEWPHATHHDGQCVDLWPVRKPGYLGELDIHSPGYDSARTEALVDLLIKWGAETVKDVKKAQFFFNDPAIYAERSSKIRKLANHYDHIHVCFRQNDRNYAKCRDFTVDTGLCPTLR